MSSSPSTPPTLAALSIPHAPISIDIHSPKETIHSTVREAVLNLCSSLFTPPSTPDNTSSLSTTTTSSSSSSSLSSSSPSTRTLPSSEDLLITPISGGITNNLFRVAHKASHLYPQQVLVRIYGDKTEILINRDTDTQAFALLAQAGFAPSLHGTFHNGRVEGYVPSRPLLPYEMSYQTPVNFVSLIAKETARLHLLDMPGDKLPILWSYLDKWFTMAEETKFDGLSNDTVEVQKYQHYQTLNIPRLGKEYQWLKTVLPSPLNQHGQVLINNYAIQLVTSKGEQNTTFSSLIPSYPALFTIPQVSNPEHQARLDAIGIAYRIVYAHNDLLSGNILHIENSTEEAISSPKVNIGLPTYLDDRVLIIDYEYGGYNYCAFDIANHFCEHAGFDFDLEKWYPKRPIQRAWCEAYLERVGIPIPTSKPNTKVENGEGNTVDTITEAFMDELLIRINQFTLASHFWWGLWAVVQGRYSPINFDFMSYAVERFKGYHKHKKEFFGMD